MEPIEQAVFLCAGAGRSDGVFRVVASAGVCEADARELLAWGPTQETLWADGTTSRIVHGHPLPSGAYAIGRTTILSAPGGPADALKASTHCLLVRKRLMARFANNPLAVLHAAEAAGLVRVFEDYPARLDPLRLEGRTPVVDTALLGRLCIDPGPDWIATLVQSVLDSVNTVLVGNRCAEEVLAGVINCLPPECRADLSLSVGLRFSRRRPYRLVALPGDEEERQRTERLYHVVVYDLAGQPAVLPATAHSWGHVIRRVLKSGRLGFFANQLARRPWDFSPQDLPALGLQMLEDLDTANFTDDPDPPDAFSAEEPSERHGEPLARMHELESDEHSAPDTEDEDWPEDWENRQETHAAHAPAPWAAGFPAAALLKPPTPSKHLDPNDPEVVRKLERLDDLVFDAISGNPESLDELRNYWPQIHRELGDGLVAESREQYLRYALTSWDQLAQRDGVRNPTVAMHALEVLCVLFGELCG